MARRHRNKKGRFTKRGGSIFKKFTKYVPKSVVKGLINVAAGAATNGVSTAYGKGLFSSIKKYVPKSVAKGLIKAAAGAATNGVSAAYGGCSMRGGCLAGRGTDFNSGRFLRKGIPGSGFIPLGR